MKKDCWAFVAALMVPGIVEAAAPPMVWIASGPASGYPAAITAAPGGGVYYTSTSVNPVNASSQAVFTEYSDTGSVVFSELFAGNPNNPGDRGENIGTDAAGNVYIDGETYDGIDGTQQGGGDVFLRKYSGTGTFLQGTQFGTQQFDWPVGTAVTANGAVYVTSGGWATNYSVPPAGSYTTVREYLPNGSAGWIAQLNTGDGTYPGNGAAASQATVLDKQGDVYCVFSNYTTQTSGGIQYINTYEYLAKVSSAGQVLWIKDLPQVANNFGLSIDSNGNLYLSAGALMKYDSNGNLLWTDGTFDDYYLSDCVGPDDTIYADSRNGYVTAFDPDGTQVWTETVQAGGGAITVSGQQLVLATGSTVEAFEVPEPRTIGLCGCFALILIRQRRRVAAA